MSVTGRYARHGLLWAIAWLLAAFPVQVASFCRFAPSFPSGEALRTNATALNLYKEAVLLWDGKFATPNKGIFSREVPLACDQVKLQPAGEPIYQPGWCLAAASKESLHLGMLALAVDQVPLAYRWMYDGNEQPAASASAGRAIAIERLEKIIWHYEVYRAKYPGLAGFLPWTGITSEGFTLDSEEDVVLPTLDNGQLVWAMMAVERALRKVQNTALADRFRDHIDVMLASFKTLFYNEAGDVSAVFAEVTVANASEPVSDRNETRAGRGELADPYEGELAILIMDMYNTWDSTGARDKLWVANKWNRRVLNYSHPQLPNGNITVQVGWRFSAHEQWKFMILPYRNASIVDRLFKNGERARTQNSRLRGIPGLLASCATADDPPLYVDRFGIRSIAWEYTEPPDNEIMVTPYGAYPVILADEAYGLAWHHAMLSRPYMQNVLGSTEASRWKDGAVARVNTWDTKVTTDLAILGGTVDLLYEVLRADATRWARWQEIQQDLNAPYTETIHGEQTSYADPPVDPISPAADFTTCDRDPGLQSEDPSISGTTRATTRALLVAALLALAGKSLL